MDDPQTREQWQEAVNGAHGALMLDSARQYDLVTGGPEVNQARCEELLRRGAAIGVTPRPDSVERFVAAVNAGQKAKKK